MTETLNLEKTLLDNFRRLSHNQKQEALNFVQSLVKTGKTNPLESETIASHTSHNISQLPKLSLKEIARLPIAERHKILAPYIAAIAEDFLTEPELTEFSVLDGKDWEEDDNN
jgi:hypothetical protein